MKKSTKVTIIASAAAIIGIAALIGVGVAVTTLFRTIIGDNGNQYSATIKRLEAARKSFNAGETAEIGPYDVTASIQKAYTPTEAEATAAQKVLDKKQRFNRPPLRCTTTSQFSLKYHRLWVPKECRESRMSTQ